MFEYQAPPAPGYTTQQTTPTQATQLHYLTRYIPRVQLIVPKMRSHNYNSIKIYSLSHKFPCDKAT